LHGPLFAGVRGVVVGVDVTLRGYAGDHHEFLITPQITALITIYNKVPMDLSSVGASTDSAVLDGIVQEVAIGTGEILFEWHS